MLTALEALSISALRDAAGDGNDGAVVVVKSYFDDSADDKRQRFCAVGGLVGSPEQWRSFQNAWASATYHLSGPFHAADCDCNPPRGIFKDWEKRDCDAIMASLVKLILKFHLMGLGSVVPVPEYRAVFPGCGEYDPYLLALKHTLVNLGYFGNMFQEHVPHEIINFQVWHEASKTTSGRAAQVFADLKALDEWRDGQFLRSFTTGDKSMLELQAADLIAREAFKHADNLGVRRTRIPVKKLKDRIAFHLWNRECLEFLRDNGGPDNLGFLTEWAYLPSDQQPLFPRFYAEDFVS